MKYKCSSASTDSGDFSCFNTRIDVKYWLQYLKIKFFFFKKGTDLFTKILFKGPWNIRTLANCRMHLYAKLKVIVINLKCHHTRCISSWPTGSIWKLHEIVVPFSNALASYFNIFRFYLFPQPSLHIMQSDEIIQIPAIYSLNSILKSYIKEKITDVTVVRIIV